MAAPHQFPPGTLVWIPSEEEVWRPAEVIRGDSEYVHVKVEEDGTERAVPAKDHVHLRNPEAYNSEGLVVVDDLTQLVHLHEAAVLNSLNVRFDIDKIYTFTGPILIAVNPFKTIPGLYEQKNLGHFKEASQKARVPHVFASANQAYRGMCDRKKCQTILISGESGAGKTESTKHVMKFLALAGAEQADRRSPVERQVLESNPLLEAFGNARTLRNDNSSRFGKFIEMQFNLVPGDSQVEGRLVGARIQTYLLEKVRVVDQQEGERNYHFFYQLCAAAAKSSESGGQYKFPSRIRAQPGCPSYKPVMLDLSMAAAPSSFRYLTKSSCFELAGIDDIVEFETTVAAMQTVGITSEEQADIFTVAGAVLYIGNILFEAPPGNSEGSAVAKASKSALLKASSLLGLEASQLEESLCYRTIKTKNEEYRKPLRVFETEDCRDALARALYGTLFDRIVQRTNESIGYDKTVSLFCGVLDIFGFECFTINSFEQLCINFTNERLQQFFNSFIFKCEEALYKREKIPWDPLDFPDNQDCVELLQGKPDGLFSMLDEECIVPQGSDKGFNSKIIKRHISHVRFGEIRTKPLCFAVFHFAGPVQYCATGFLDKNKDQLSYDTRGIILNSKKDFVAALFRELLKRGEPGGAKKQTTVSSEFKSQLVSLMDTIDVTEPHFIRCIKPNAENLPDAFDRRSVTEQLRYGGVLQAVQVSRAGYPVRVAHKECFDDYKYLVSQKFREATKKDSDKRQANLLMEHLAAKLGIVATKLGSTTWAVGESLVFFKHESFEILQTARMVLHRDMAVTVQSRWKGRRQYYFYQTLRKCTITIQALVRGKIARNRAVAIRKERATVQIQAFIRRVIARLRYLRTRKHIIFLQSWYRGNRGRQLAYDRKQYKAATMLQSHWRGYREKVRYQKLCAGVLIAQLRWRSKAARQQLRRLKQEQKEAATLLTQKQNLQLENKNLRKEVSELRVHAYALTSERDSLRSKAEQLQVQLKQAEELSSNRAATHTVENSDVEQELRKRIETVEMELAKQKQENHEQKQLNHELNQKYHAVLENSNMMIRNPNLTESAKYGDSRGTGGHGPKSLDILILGGQSVGKTTMLKLAFRKFNDMANLELCETNQTLEPRIHHYKMAIESRTLSVLDVPGDPAFDVYADAWIAKTQRIIVVYNVSDRSTQRTEDLMKMCSEYGSRIILFGNKYDHDHNKSDNNANVARLVDIAAGYRAKCVEATDLSDLFCTIVRDLETELPIDATEKKRETVRRQERGSGISSMLTSLKSLFGNVPRGPVGGEYLNCSAKGQKSAYRQLVVDKDRESSPLIRDVVACNEIRGSESAITCIAFGQEKLHLRYVLLAVACKDGSIVVYRIYRTDMEVELLMKSERASKEYHDNRDDESKDGQVVTHKKFLGHARAVTSLFFSPTEEMIVTTSIDGSVRFWDIETGDVQKVFTDSSAALVAVFLPFNPNVIVASNSNSLLRFFSIKDGVVIQKLKLDSQVRTLCFDDTGTFCLAGTKHGSIHVLEATDSNSTRFKFKFNLTKASITCITFVASTSTDTLSCLLVNATDHNVAIVDCIYGPTGELSNLRVRHRVKIEHSLLPLHCCHSPVGGGWLITASENNSVYIHSLQPAKAQQKGSGANLVYHKSPLLCVAINAQSTLLASADSSGLIVLWRRFDFSQFDKMAHSGASP